MREKSQLTLIAPPIICSRRQLKFCHFFKNNQKGMIFHENRRPSKIRKDVAKFVVCCSRDWGFKGLIART